MYFISPHIREYRDIMATSNKSQNQVKTVNIQDGPGGKVYSITLPMVLAQQLEKGDTGLCRKILENIRDAAIPETVIEPVPKEPDPVPDSELLSNTVESDASDIEERTTEEAECGNGSRDGESLWTREATLLLISLYKQNESKMESLGCRKKAVWATITKELNKLYSFTQTQVESKWRGLVRSYKKVVDSKKQTGGKRVTFQYFNEMEEILSTRHDIQPPLLLSSAPCTKDSANQPRKKFSVRKNTSTWTETVDCPTNFKTDELSESDKSDLNSSVSTEPEMSNLKKSDSKSAKRRRENRKSEDVAVQTLAFLKEMEEARREEQRRVTAQMDERNSLLKQLIETLKK